MILRAERAELEKRVMKGDYERAAEIYHTKSGIAIHARHIQRFLQKPDDHTTGRFKHDPETMYAALVEAVAEREKKVRDTTERAKRIREGSLELAA